MRAVVLSCVSSKVNVFLAQRIFPVLEQAVDPDKQYFTSDKFLTSSTQFGKILNLQVLHLRLLIASG